MGANANLAELARKFKLDGSLSMPWTVEEFFAAIEDAERIARAKRARPPFN